MKTANAEKQARLVDEPGYRIFSLLAQIDRMLEHLCMSVAEVDRKHLDYVTVQWLQSRGIVYIGDLFCGNNERYITQQIERVLQRFGIRKSMFDAATCSFIEEVMKARRRSDNVAAIARQMRRSLLERSMYAHALDPE